MLKKLEEVLHRLPSMFSKTEIWQSLVINKRKPTTYRVFTTLDCGSRVCLHRFLPCDTHEAFYHPHPWPAAFLLLRGAYQMKLGYAVHGSQDLKPVDVSELLLTTGSRYEIVDPDTWHSVAPLCETYTIMVNDAPWDADHVSDGVRTTKGKDLDSLSTEELEQSLNMFSYLLTTYQLQFQHLVKGPCDGL